ncbi:hypothetical protein B0H10DRAFT_2085061 [Mycena sp. CBHHK59/15]|nr:hypothetical protein B0H10DRAFT_2085061 [Mycena sp. CBHHK59/15]
MRGRQRFLALKLAFLLSDAVLSVMILVEIEPNPGSVPGAFWINCQHKLYPQCTFMLIRGCMRCDTTTHCKVRHT